MPVKTYQRGATNNQSTADFERENLFTFGNRYSEEKFLNNTSDTLVAEPGILVTRNTGSALNKTVLVPAVSGTLGAIVGILAVGANVEMLDAAEIDTNMCISGDIDASLLVFPEGITLNTVVNDKLLKDVLTDLGFVLNNVTENSNLDN